MQSRMRWWWILCLPIFVFGIYSVSNTKSTNHVLNANSSEFPDVGYQFTIDNTNGAMYKLGLTKDSTLIATVVTKLARNSKDHSVKRGEVVIRGGLIVKTLPTTDPAFTASGADAPFFQIPSVVGDYANLPFAYNVVGINDAGFASKATIAGKLIVPATITKMNYVEEPPVDFIPAGAFNGCTGITGYDIYSTIDASYAKAFPINNNSSAPVPIRFFGGVTGPAAGFAVGQSPFTLIGNNPINIALELNNNLTNSFNLFSNSTNTVIKTLKLNEGCKTFGENEFEYATNATSYYLNNNFDRSITNFIEPTTNSYLYVDDYNYNKIKSFYPTSPDAFIVNKGLFTGATELPKYNQYVSNYEFSEPYHITFNAKFVEPSIVAAYQLSGIYYSLNGAPTWMHLNTNYNNEYNGPYIVWDSANSAGTFIVHVSAYYYGATYNTTTGEYDYTFFDQYRANKQVIIKITPTYTNPSEYTITVATMALGFVTITIGVLVASYVTKKKGLRK